jgi:hypothetical protein
VNGRNPAAPWMDVIDNGISHLSTGGGFIPSTVCWTLLDYHPMKGAADQLIHPQKYIK